MPNGNPSVVSLEIETAGAGRLPSWDPGVRGGIPEVAGKLVLTPQYIRKYPDFASALNAAIQEVVAPGAVVIPAQTSPYQLTGPVHMRSGVVVRGEGPRRTTIHANLVRQGSGIEGSGFHPLFSFQGHRIDALEVAEPIARGAQGLRLQPSISGARPEVGQTVLLTMDNDPAHGWETYEWEKRIRGQLLRVTAVDDDTITVDTPVRLEYPSLRWPRVELLRAVEGAGLEDLTIENDATTGAHWTTAFWYAASCWLRNCELARIPDVACWVWNSRWVTVESCYVHDARDYSGGKAYGVNLCTHATDCLVTDNIFQRLRHSMLAHFGASGNVFSYNYSLAPAMSDLSLHGRYPYMNLFEGNLAAQAYVDGAWGRAGEHNTFFRNRLTKHQADYEAQHGVDYVDYEDHEVMHVMVDQDSHQQNIVGNTLVDGRLLLRGCAETWVEQNRVLEPQLGLPTVEQDGGVHGTVNIQNGPPAADVGETAVQRFRPSLYLEEPPHFWVAARRKWPATGSDVDGAAPDQRQPIPAQDRYEQVVLRPARPPLRPSLAALGATIVAVGVPVQLRITGWHPEAGWYLRYVLDWGDGTAAATDLAPAGSALTQTRSWSHPGTYLVRCRARDQYGLLSPWSRTVRIEVTSNGPAPQPGRQVDLRPT